MRLLNQTIACLPWAALVAVVFTGVWHAAAAYCYHHEDFGIYTQALAHLSLANLNPFLSGRQLAIFNDHLDPVLFIAAPLTHLLPPWQGALLAELIAVSLALPALLWLLRCWSIDTRGALLLGSIMFLQPAVVSALRFPVHPTTWAVAPMMLVVAAVLLERWRLVILGLVLLFAYKEEFPFCGIALGFSLWREQRPAAVKVLTLSMAWLLIAFVLRPWFLGPTSQYGGAIFAGLFDSPLPYFLARFQSRGLSSGLWNFVLPQVPVLLWMLATRRPMDRRLLALALPLLAIRFLGMSWRHHYLAVLVPIVVGLVAKALKDRPVERWLVVGPVVLMVALNAGAARFTLSRLGMPVASAPYFCPASSRRLSALDDATETLSANRGAALVSANIFPHLARKHDVYALGGFQGPSTSYRWALIELPPNGDTYPLTEQQVRRAVDELRIQASSILVDDSLIFFAEGPFVLPAQRD